MIFSGLKSDGTPGGTASAAAPEERGINGEELWWPPAGAAGVTVTELTALHLSPFLTGVSVISTDVAILPLDVYQAEPDGGRRTAREHPLTELLTRSPDGETTPVCWRQALMGHALEFGNGYAEIQRRGNGRPYALHLLDPCATRPKRIDGQLSYQANGNHLPASDVLHIAGFGFDGLSGYHLVHLLTEAIGIGLGSQSFSADYFANGSEPGGVIEVDGKLGAEGRRNIKEGWELKHGVPGQRHKVGVLEQGAKWKPTQSDPEKSQLIETRKFQAIDVNRPLRLPPHKYGDYSQSHLANIEASNLDYLMTTLIGWLVTIEQQFNLKLLTRAEWAAGYYVEHNVNALLRGDIKSRFEAYGTALDKGWMCRDEVRRRENQNPIGPEKGGDLYLVQSQNIPLEQAGQGKPEPATAPAPAADPAAPDPQTDPTPDGQEPDA